MEIVDKVRPVAGWGVGASLALVALCGGCGGSSKAPAGKESAPTASSSSAPEPPPGAAQQTRDLEQKAAGYQERFSEIQASDLSADEKARAASELVDEQQRAIQESESGSAGSDE